MRKKFDLVKLGSILTESKEEAIFPNSSKRIRVKLNVEGIEKRPVRSDVKGATKYYIRRKKQFIYGKQNLFKGAFGVIPDELDGYESSADLPAFDVDKNCNPYWIYYFLRNGGYYKKLINISSGTGSRRVHPKKLYNVSIPLPEREIQEELISRFKKIDDLVKFLKKNVVKNLEKTNNLRKRILNEAISGRLIDQNFSDEPALTILNKIENTKKKIVKKKASRMEKRIEFKDIKIQKDLPKGWVLTRLHEICYKITSGSTPAKKYFNSNEGIPFLKVYNIVDNKINFQKKPQYIDENIHKTKNKRCKLYPGDVIMNIVGPPLGKTAIIPDSYPEWNCNQAIVFFRPILKELTEWIYLFLQEGSFLNSIELIGTAGQDNISVTKSRNILIPLPPINEQKRIIKKVDKLMNLIAKLENKNLEDLRNAELLMESILYEIFSQ